MSTKPLQNWWDDRKITVISILAVVLLGVMGSVVFRFTFPYNRSEVSKATVNVGFGDNGDSITATATIRAEIPVDEVIKDSLNSNEETGKEGGSCCQDNGIGSWIKDSLSPEKEETQEESWLGNFFNQDKKEETQEETWLGNFFNQDKKKESSWLSNPSSEDKVEDKDSIWLKTIVDKICQVRLNFWNSIIEFLVKVKDFVSLSLNWLRMIICEILKSVLDQVDTAIETINCNLSPEPSADCEGFFLRNILNWLEDQDRLVLEKIPTALPTSGFDMIQKLLISFATIFGFLIIIVLCIFFDDTPEGKQIVKKFQDMFGEEPVKRQIPPSRRSSFSKMKKINTTKTPSKVSEKKPKRKKIVMKPKSPNLTKTESPRSRGKEITTKKKQEQVKKPIKQESPEKEAQENFVKIEVGIDKTN